MKKTMLIILSLVLIILLGFAIYVSFSFLDNENMRQTGLGNCCTQENNQFGQRDRMGPGMMGQNMMGRSETFINNEYEYLVHMIPHHEEAIYTATILKENTNREEMKQFAESIIASQSEEIEKMTAWLSTWYPEKDHTIDYQPMMRDIEDLKGEELDKVFLEDMIPHHMEAVMMSQQLLSRGVVDHEEISLLAIDIRNNQRDEIHMMMNRLNEWYGNGFMSPSMHGGSSFLWAGFIALFALIGLVIWLIRAVSSGSIMNVSSNKKSAKELLDTRYAKGEISQEEYQEMRKNFEN